MSDAIVAALERIAVAVGARAIEPMCVDAEGVAALLCVSVRQVYRLDDSGKLPESIELGGCKRWRAREVRDWINAGAPARKAWAWSEST